MANGLAVVSIKIPVLEKAAIADALSFYESSSGKSLAEAIMKCDYNQSSRELLNILDQKFEENIKSII